MVRAFLIILTGVFTSLYIFSFEFTFLPGVNTKMILAAAGLVSLFFQLGKSQDAIFNKDIFIISVLACIISLIGVASVTVNGTSDFAYARYIASMWTWLGGAYALCLWMKKVHGEVPWWLVCNYLVAVCFAQCVLALMIEYVPNVKTLVNTYIGSMSGMGSAAEFDDRERLYGIGCAVDMAGTRFASVLMIVAYLCFNLNREKLRKWLYLYLFAFLFIGTVGNMVSRTTTVGLIMALVYWCCVSAKNSLVQYSPFWKALMALLVVFVPLVVFCYHVSPELRENIRFGFEGFFSMFEKGYWETNSNNVLVDMYRFPETFKTWIIGDGYFDNPMSDPYYMGYQWKGFYMGTDVGYLRYIFYFGLLGLMAFLLFMAKVVQVCAKQHASQKGLFLLLGIIQGIVWFKVSTDIFLIFALFIVLSPDWEKKETEYVRRIDNNQKRGLSNVCGRYMQYS